MAAMPISALPAGASSSSDVSIYPPLDDPNQPMDGLIRPAVSLMNAPMIVSASSMQE
jgi:hypothetical protein